MRDRDPVAIVLGGTGDLYDVAEWDSRSVIDKLSVVVYTVLHGIKRYGLLALALLFFVAQLAFAGLLVLEEPRLGFLAALSAVPAFLLVAYVWYDDPRAGEPIDALAITFVLAVLFASFAARSQLGLPDRVQADPRDRDGAVFLPRRRPHRGDGEVARDPNPPTAGDDFDAVIDGAVYGAVAGLGFATIENALYITQGTRPPRRWPASPRSNARLERPPAGRSSARATCSTPPSPATTSAWPSSTREHAGPIVVKGILIAALIHATYNTLVTYLPAVLPVWNLFVSSASSSASTSSSAISLYRKLSRYTSYYHRAEDESDAVGATAEDG